MKIPNRTWTDKEDSLLIGSYRSKTAPEIGSMLNRSTSAVNNRATRLGLRKRSDISPGDIFGKLTVIEKSDQKDQFGAAYFLCICDCGIKKIVRRANLKNNHTRSCGCLYKEIKRAEEFSTKAPGETSFNTLYRVLKQHAKKRSKERSILSITPAEHKEIITQNCHYCGVGPKMFNPYAKSDGSIGKVRVGCQETVNRASIYVNSIDRIDSNLGYILLNCVPCCFMCNRMKTDFRKEEFLDQIEKIHNFQKSKDK